MNVKRLALVGFLMASMPVANADFDPANAAASNATVQAGQQANQALINATCGPAPDGLACGPNNPCTEAKLQESRAWVKCAMAVLMPKPTDFAK